MPHADEPLMPDAALVERLVEAERRCQIDWVQAIADLPGNPYRAAVGRFGGATATVCGGVPAEVLNRVFGFRVDDAPMLDEIVRTYEEHGASPVFDIAPTTVTPFWEGPNTLSALTRAGFRQAAFHQLLYRPLTAPALAPPSGGDTVEGVVVREAGRDEAEAFSQLYASAWGDPGVGLVWLDHPAFTCYIASVDGTDAALGVLHVAGGTASMANALTAPALRGRGSQTALLRRRLADAARAGCDLAVSQCRPGSVSQRNQLRAGFSIAETKVWWLRDRP